MEKHGKGMEWWRSAGETKRKALKRNGIAWNRRETERLGAAQN